MTTTTIVLRLIINIIIITMIPDRACASPVHRQSLVPAAHNEHVIFSSGRATSIGIGVAASDGAERHGCLGGRDDARHEHEAVDRR